MTNPYEAPQAALVDVATALTPRSYGGIQRMPFVGILVALIVIAAIMEVFIMRTHPMNELSLIVLMPLIFRQDGQNNFLWRKARKHCCVIECA